MGIPRVLSEALREVTVTGEVCVKWPGWQAVPSTATAHLIEGFASCQTTELCDAILEGYPKSKKQFFEEVGIETDEDHNVTLPDP